MRTHRVALIVIFSFIATLCVVLPTLPGNAGSTRHQESTTWTSSAPAASPLPTQQLSNQSLQPLATFATAVAHAQQAQAAAQAAASAARLSMAASSPTPTANGPSAPAVTSTPAPGGCAPSYQAAQEARAEAAGVPCAWVPTAICEEQGYDDANYGYFGIQSWEGYGGYPNAGSAPLSVQLGWEAAHGQGPPDAPGQCHGY